MCSSCVRYILYLALLVCPLAGQAVERGDIAPSFDLPVLLNPSPAQLDSAQRASSRFPLLSLSEYQGKVIYLDFWHSACVPCRQSLPLLNALRGELRQQYAQEFEVIAVNVDRFPQDALAFLAQFTINFPVTSDVTDRTLDAYGLSVFPTAFLLDRQGTVKAVHTGFAKEDMRGIEAALRELLSNTPQKSNKSDMPLSKPVKQEKQSDQHTTIRI